MFSKISLKYKLIFAPIFVIVVALGALSFVISKFQEKQLEKDLEQEAAINANITASNLESAVLFNDSTAMLTTLQSLSFRSNITYATVLSENKELKAEIVFDKNKHLRKPTNFYNDSLFHAKKTKDFLFATQPIYVDGKAVANLYLVYSHDEMHAKIQTTKKYFIVTALIVILISAIILFFAQKIVIRPILNLTQSSINISKNNEFEEVKVESEDELGTLTLTFNKMVRDIVHARDTAEASKKMKEDFLSNMSHEIRTPMNGIIGMIDMLESSTNPTPIQKDYLDTIKSSSKSLLTIINDILDLSKLEAGKMTLIMQPISVQRINHQIKELFRAKAAEKRINLYSEYGKDLPECIMCDTTRIKQVLSNYISNAIKFTDAGSVILRTELIEQQGDNITLKYSVIDTGIGMKENEIDFLFKAFNQLDSSSIKKYEGTGLGLAISKQIVTLFNGEVGVESTFGKGSTFWFTIKTQMAQQLAENTPLEKVAIDSNEKINLHVLLVDDKYVNLLVCKTMLTSLGCTVITAKDGLEAINAFEKEKFDIVLMDIQMPKMDGVEATRILKEKHHSTPPIIALTANAMEGDKEKYLALGLDDYLPKPIELHALKEMLTKYDNSKQNKSI